MAARNLHSRSQRLANPKALRSRRAASIVNSLFLRPIYLHAVQESRDDKGVGPQPPILDDDAKFWSQRYQVGPDPFHNVQRLDLFRFDGSPMHPMFLAYNPPQMLPTSTLNPTATSTAPAGRPTSQSRVKRTTDDEAGETIEPLNKKAILTPTEPFNADRWWWVGVGLTAVGTMLYMYPSS